MNRSTSSSPATPFIVIGLLLITVSVLGRVVPSPVSPGEIHPVIVHEPDPSVDPGSLVLEVAFGSMRLIPREPTPVSRFVVFGSHFALWRGREGVRLLALRPEGSGFFPSPFLLPEDGAAISFRVIEPGEESLLRVSFLEGDWHLPLPSDWRDYPAMVEFDGPPTVTGVEAFEEGTSEHSVPMSPSVAPLPVSPMPGTARWALELRAAASVAGGEGVELDARLARLFSSIRGGRPVVYVAAAEGDDSADGLDFRRGTVAGRGPKATVSGGVSAALQRGGDVVILGGSYPGLSLPSPGGQSVTIIPVGRVVVGGSDNLPGPTPPSPPSFPERSKSVNPNPPPQ